MVPVQYLRVPLNNLKGQDNLGRLQNLALISFVSGPHLMMLESGQGLGHVQGHANVLPTELSLQFLDLAFWRKEFRFGDEKAKLWKITGTFKFF